METQKNYKFVKRFRQWIFKFATKRWSVINNESKGVYSHKNPIKVLTSTLQSSFCCYSDAYILVSGNIAVVVVF